MTPIPQHGRVLVDFYAPWCAPCRALGEIIDGLQGINVVKINIDEDDVTATKHAIRALPTLILFEDGEPVRRITGGMTKTQLETWLA